MPERLALSAPPASARHEPEPSVPALEFAGVDVVFGRHAVLRDADLQLLPGRCYGLLGPNGSGKTTLLRSAVGLMRPRCGTIRLLGRQPPAPGGAVAASFGPRLVHPRRRAATELRLHHAALRSPRWSFEAAWARTGLARRDVRCGELSLGQAHRLAHVCALLAPAGLLVLDEPTVGLDADATVWLGREIGAFTSEGGCVLMSSHDVAETSAWSDELLLLHEGKVSTRSTVGRVGTSHEVRLTSSEPGLLRQVLASTRWDVVESAGERFTVRGADGADVGRLMAMAMVPLTSMAASTPGARGGTANGAGPEEAS